MSWFKISKPTLVRNKPPLRQITFFKDFSLSLMPAANGIHQLGKVSWTFSVTTCSRSKEKVKLNKEYIGKE